MPNENHGLNPDVIKAIQEMKDHINSLATELDSLSLNPDKDSDRTKHRLREVIARHMSYCNETKDATLNW